ncbi:MAG: M48 family peptidase [Bryobacterales bacterium]|nr:M48 family peptidase [Bryobacterales bacterium]
MFSYRGGGLVVSIRRLLILSMVHSEAVPGEQNATGSVEPAFARAFAECRPRTALAGVMVEFCEFAAATSYVSLRDGVLRIRLCDVLRHAPEAVWHALGHVLVSKLFRRPVPRRFADRYRRYLNRQDVQALLERVRQERGRKRVLAPGGVVFDLVERFERLNREYFHGLMARPDLGWSVTGGRWELGHYDRSHHTIVLNRMLDHESVPAYVVDYVLYHEMLHLVFPVERKGGRRCVHPEEFRAREREFARYGDAEAWIKSEFGELVAAQRRQIKQPLRSR